jgi:Lar family restriction alleviation protein
MTISRSSPDMGGCPFCGSKDVELSATASHWPAVGCNECGALGPSTDLHSDKAIEAWNARAGLAQAPAWQPIETVPKDGNPIIVWDDPVMGEAYYDIGEKSLWWANTGPGDYTADAIYPTLWRPMPPPPSPVPSTKRGCGDPA